jgi:hypothetical protein
MVASLGDRDWTASQMRELLSKLLDAVRLDYDQRVELLGAVLVSEAVRPYWEAGHAPDEAHDLLRRHDEELADVVEALAPMLLGRAEARDEARLAVHAVEALYGVTPGV